jgi:putative endonuclease
MRVGWIYIMTNRSEGTLNGGVTNDLERRIGANKAGTGSVFTRRYTLHRRVYCEPHDDISAAIQRETSLKRVVAGNPEWADPAADWR